MLHVLLTRSLRLLTSLLVLLLPAVGFRFISSFLPCCWVCSFGSHELLTYCCLFPSPSSTLRVGLRVSSALVLLLTLLTLTRSSEYRRPSSIVVLRLRAAFWQSGVASFLLLVTTGAVGRGSFSVRCLNSLAAHRDLSHRCRTSRLASGALLQRHFVVVYDSVVRFWPPPTPLHSNAPLRDCGFAACEDWFLFRTLPLLHVLG